LAPHYPNFAEESTKAHIYSRIPNNTLFFVHDYLIPFPKLWDTPHTKERAKSWREAAVAVAEEAVVVGKVRLPKSSGERLRDTQ
jgi:hypothetical protein